MELEIFRFDIFNAFGFSRAFVVNTIRPNDARCVAPKSSVSDTDHAVNINSDRLGYKPASGQRKKCSLRYLRG